jgi:hypothetical protein
VVFYVPLLEHPHSCDIWLPFRRKRQQIFAASFP